MAGSFSWRGCFGAPPVSAALLAAGLVDEDAVHGLGRSGEEMAAAIPTLGLSTSTSRR